MEQVGFALSDCVQLTPESQDLLVPFPRPRPVGPGRIELGLRQRVEEAVAREREARELAAARERELELLVRIERGSQRRLDRLEEAAQAAQAALEEAGQRENRLILALGALQRENELLRERAALAAAPRSALPAGRRRPSWWRRLRGAPDTRTRA